MAVGFAPKFTVSATKLWATDDTKNLLTSNVWCGKNRHAVTVTNFSGAIRNKLAYISPDEEPRANREALH